MPVLNRDEGVGGGHGVVRSDHQQCLKGQKYPALLCDCNGAKLSGVKLSSVKLSWCQIVRCQIVL